jgi:hypothetical protein
MHVTTVNMELVSDEDNLDCLLIFFYTENICCSCALNNGDPCFIDVIRFCLSNFTFFNSDLSRSKNVPSFSFVKPLTLAKELN